jgi:hypothetical protein
MKQKELTEEEVKTKLDEATKMLLDLQFTILDLRTEIKKFKYDKTINVSQYLDQMNELKKIELLKKLLIVSIEQLLKTIIKKD